VKATFTTLKVANVAFATLRVAGQRRCRGS